MAEIGNDIHLAAKLLRRGKLVGIPTETVYGLAANALNVEAITHIFSCKNRPSFDPLIVHISGIEELDKYVIDIPILAKKLAESFWPGPLTLLLPKSSIIPDLVTSGLPNVGIRVPSQSMTLSLLKELPFPLAAPSANPFGYVSPTTAAHVNDQLGDKIDYILDGGQCEVGIESTIVGFEDDKAIIYRLGGLCIDDIEKITGKVQLKLAAGSNPNAPGQLDAHYAPKCKLILGHSVENELARLPKDAKIALIRFQKIYTGFGAFHQYVLASNGNTNTAATRLFAILRLLDKNGYEYAIAEPAPEIGLGPAINDRLRRASTVI